MNLHLIRLLSIVGASPITNSYLGSPSIGKDAQNVDVIQAEHDLNGFPGVASLDLAQTPPPSTSLPGQAETPSTKENVCCTDPGNKETDNLTCPKHSNPSDSCPEPPEPIYSCPKDYEGDLKNCDTFTPDDVAALAAIHAIFTGGVLVWFCVGTDPAWYCPPWW